MLPTKKQLCEIICNEHKIKTENMEISLGDIFHSSRLAVALQHLGILQENPELEDYASDREGILLSGPDYTGQMRFLTLRDLLNILPDDEVIDEEER